MRISCYSLPVISTALTTFQATTLDSIKRLGGHTDSGCQYLCFV